MTKLYFIRHGKTEWNQEGRFQGKDGDSPLLAESFEQIKLLGASLKDVTFKHAFTSPIKRACDTAELTLKAMDATDVPLTKLPGLAEFGMGVWEGMRFVDVEAGWPEMLYAYRHQPNLFDAAQVDGAESFAQVQGRFTEAVKQAVAEFGGEDVNLIFFSHGMSLTAGMAALVKIPLAETRARGGLSNTSTSILETHDGETFVELTRNDTTYLNLGDDQTNTV
ncbi:histidine phosphatase family protein [Weissella ceti]|uniref:Histidine phosphatase family protein n=1 Tax=Weissella ceti TaxID=759620 RepID=A0ABT3E416_9LACO|nr:histidine phosphatase family protein [Weissella ceti]MCW0952678.1 histidine phosphatase family protein [Weissella ceti]QVK12380.1 histidine phosphatase family protein [Weissella ceti]